MRAPVVTDSGGLDPTGQTSVDKKKPTPAPRVVNPTQDRPAPVAAPQEPTVTVQREGGYTPSPLSPYIVPVPKVETPKTMTQRLYDINFYAPNLADKPGMSLALLMDAEVSTREIQQIAALEKAISNRMHLEGLDPQMQLDVFSAMSKKDLAAVIAVGYLPPNPEDLPIGEEDGGMWGWMKDARDTVVETYLPSQLEGAGQYVTGVTDSLVGGATDAVSDVASWSRDQYRAADQGIGDELTSMGITDSVIGDIASKGQDLFAATTGKSLEYGMKALSVPQELVFQDLRAFRLLQGGDLSFGSFSDIEKAFAIAEDGNKSFDQDYLARAKAMTGDDELFDLALEVNSLPEEERMDWLAQKVSEAEKQGGMEAAIAMSAKLQSTAFGDAMGLVDGAHISFGRMVAQDYGISYAGDDDFSMISGSLDLTARITLDPWLLAGAAGKGVSAAKYGINVSRLGRTTVGLNGLKIGSKLPDIGQLGARIDEVFKLKTTRRWWEGTAENGALKHLNTIRNTTNDVERAEAVRQLKRYNGIDDTVNQAILQAPKSVKFRNADDVAEFMKSEAGKASIFTGKAGFRLTKLQHKNMLQHAIAQTKPGKVVNWLDMKAGVDLASIAENKGVRTLSELGTDSADEILIADAKAVGSVVNQAWRKSPWYRASTMVTRLTTRVPVPKDGKLWLDDAGSVREIEAMARTFGPRQWADNVVAQYTLANEGGRREIYKGMMHTLGEASGMTRTSEGKAALDRIISRAVDQNYVSRTGADDMGDGTKAGIYANQLRPYVQMPEFSMLHAQAQRMGVLSKLGGHFTKDGADWFVQRVFKPSVLLRPALVLRNAGEEVLRHVVDNGPLSYAQGRMLRTHLRGGYARKGAFRDPALEDEWRFFRLFTKPAWKSYERAVGKDRALGHRLSVRDWFVGGKVADLRRGFLVKTVGKDTIKDIEDLWDNYPRFRMLYNSEVMDASRRAFVGNVQDLRGGSGWAARHAAGRKSGTIQFIGKGGFEAKAIEGYDGAVRWTMQLDKLAADEFGSIAFENLLDEPEALRLLVEELSTNPVALRAVARERLGVEEWAQRIYNDVKFHFEGQNGRFQQKLYDHLVPEMDDGVRRIDYDKFDFDQVDELVPSVDDRPLHVLGQEVIHHERDVPGLISRIVDSGFDYIGQSTNYISRGPLFFANMIDSVRDAKPLYHAYLESGVPKEAVEAYRRQYARKMVQGSDGEPLTIYTGRAHKYSDGPDPDRADLSSNDYVVGIDSSENKSVALNFAGGRIDDGGDDLIDGVTQATRRGHVYSGWLRKGKTVDVNEALDAGTYETLVRTFAKKAGLDEDWVNGQLFRVQASGTGSIDDFYQASKAVLKKADGTPDLEAVNTAFKGMLKAHKYKMFTRGEGSLKVHTVIDKSYIVPDKPPLHPEALTSKWAKQQQYKIAEQRALERTIAMVDNPVMRSQFSVIARNLFPFWRAQEEFYRRWARTFKHSPESFRKAQLMMMGFEHSGFVQKDDAGHMYFIYPYLGEATEVVRKFGERLGMDFGNIPQVSQYSGQIRFLNQGIDPNNIQPAVSPLLGFPVSIIAGLFPETQSVENVILGEQGAGRDPYMALLPTPLRRLIEGGVVFQTNPDGWTEQMMSAGMSSLATLEAAGLTPPDDATPAEVDAYIERVREYTRFTLGFRALWGAIAPTPLDSVDQSTELPEHLQFDGYRTIDSSFMAFVDEMGYEKAITLWAATNPDQMPFTTAKTESTSGAYWKSTKIAGEFYQDNKALFDKYPKAAAFLIPQDPEGEYDTNVFAIEMANSLRARKDMGQFYRDMKLGGKLGDYYDSLDVAAKSIEEAKAAGDYGLAAAYEASISDWKQGYVKQNPLVGEYLSSGQLRTYEREQTVNEMRGLIGEAPDSPAADVIGDMITSYDLYKKAIAANPGSTSAAEGTRAALTQSFQDYMGTTAKTNDNAWLFYNKTFRWME